MPDSSKPRERFLKQGSESLSDAELLAIILEKGMCPGGVLKMSNDLISRFGLKDLFNCSIIELQRVRGIGPTKAMQILSIAELNKRYEQCKNPVIKIKSSKDVYEYFRHKLKDEKQENFHVLLLDTQNQIICDHLITRGILNASIIHPREIFKPAIRDSAFRIILVHNHPSGDPSPSEEDLEVTKKLMEVGEQIDIKVLDHVIVGKRKYWSWSERE